MNNFLQYLHENQLIINSLLFTIHRGNWIAIINTNQESDEIIPIETAWEQFRKKVVDIEDLDQTIESQKVYNNSEFCASFSLDTPTDSQFEALRAALLTATHLRYLGFYEFSYENMLKVTPVLATHPSITVLCIEEMKSECGTSLEALMQILNTENCALKSLSFTECDLGIAGTTSIAKHLPKQLRQLILNAIFMDEEAPSLLVAPLVEKLSHPQCRLSLLGMNHCMLTNEEAKAFAKLLTHSRFLKRLDLCGNAIDDEGILALMDSLEQNKILDGLTLEQNKIDPSNAKRITSVICNHPALVDFAYPFNFPEDQKEIVEKALHVNRGKYAFGKPGREKLSTLLLLRNCAEENPMKDLPMEMLLKITDYVFDNVPGKTSFFMSAPRASYFPIPLQDRRALTENEIDKAADAYSKKIGFSS